MKSVNEMMLLISVLIVVLIGDHQCECVRVIASACNYTTYVNGGGRDLFYDAQWQPGYCEIPVHKSLRRQVCCNCVVIETNEVCRPGAAAPSHWNSSEVLTNLEGLVRLSVQYGQDQEYWFCCNQQWFHTVQPQYRSNWIRELAQHEKAIDQFVIKQVEEDSVRDERKISGKQSTKPDKSLHHSVAFQQRTTSSPRPIVVVTQPAVRFFTDATIPVSCFDSHKDCPIWAGTGYCTTNLWVHKYCQRSCNTCAFHAGSASLLTSRPQPTTTFRPTTVRPTTAARQRTTVKRSIAPNTNQLANNEQFWRTSTTNRPQVTSCQLEKKPANKCLVGVRPSKISWYFHKTDYECLAFYDIFCADDQTNNNRFDSWSSCSQKCKMADAPACVANSAPAVYFGSGEAILCNPRGGAGNTGCPANYNCVQGAFFAMCCSAIEQETYERNYNPRCPADQHMERFEEQGLVLSLLGKRCEDNFCSPSSECVQLDKFAHCCSSERLSFRRTNQRGELLFL